MNAGLTNLATLKGWLLASSLQSSTDYDAQIAAIGKGVLGQLEKFCNRKFARVEGDLFECSADRSHLVLMRFPVETITTLEERPEGGDYAELPASTILQRADDRGMIFFGTQLGTFLGRLRVTYTGGYWFETAEPTDESYPTTQPEGSTAVPADLLLAWKLQCEHVWTQRDKLGLQLGQEQSATSALAQAKLLPSVVEMIRPFIRYALY